MAEKMKRLPAIRAYFERQDNIAPTGGKKMPTSEFKGLSQADLKELGEGSAANLGVEIEA